MINWMPFEFASPLVFLGAAGVIILFILFALKKRAVYQFSDFRLLGKRGGKALIVVIWVLIVAETIALFGALARPEVLESHPSPIYSRDFVVVFDYSSSMDSGFSGYSSGKSKFDAGRDAAFAFIEHRREDRSAYVLFASNAYSMPLLKGSQHILESRILQEGLSERKSSPLKGLGDRLTNIEKGVFAALVIFEKMSAADTQVIILISDLEGDIEKTSAALQEAKLRGVSRIYILVVLGSPNYSGLYAQEYSYPARIKAATKSFSEGFLTFFDIRDEQALAEAYVEIDRLETSKSGEEIVKSKRSITQYFVVSAFALFTFITLFSFTVWRKVF